MKYVNIVGPLDMFDEFILKHIIHKNIQLEPSYKSIHVPGLIPFGQDTSLDNLHKRMHMLNEKLGAQVKKYSGPEIEKELSNPVNIPEMEAFIEEIEEKLSGFKKQAELTKCDIEQRVQIIRQLQPLSKLELNIDEVFHFTFMKFRFGFLPRTTWLNQRNNLEELEAVVIPVSEEEENIWLSYFMPSSNASVVDSVFSAIGFQRVRISDQVKGMPRTAIEKMNEEIQTLQEETSRNEALETQYLSDIRDKFERLYNKVLYFSKINDVKKFAAHDQELFFLVGWIPGADYTSFDKEIEPLDQVILKCEDPEDIANLEPPTILRNSRLFKPFESLVNMYGIPSSNEMDPTPVAAITYVLMFGIMFGDVGQGAMIALLGLYLYKVRKSSLGGIMMYVGISSTVFGFVYGSVFGSEIFVKPLWVNPLHDKNTINTLLYGAVGYGAFIILLTMIMNMINNIRTRNWRRLLFDKNGVAGFLFYGGVIAIIISALITGNFRITAWEIVVVIVIPAIMILLKEPLGNLLMRKEHIFPKEKGMYFVEAGFDLFETVMSFFSGTISFARVGAFALNHAGLSLAVWTLYDMMQGVGGIIVVIIGNLLTIGLEGLIVGIQCMRLEYYEMFGRFYTGEGKEFQPVTITDD